MLRKKSEQNIPFSMKFTFEFVGNLLVTFSNVEYY
jgi:hypothetical protein